ncbi:MAG TPA: hypothetical protein VK572_09815 [Burkholderiales bacterium]|nr:hypothetical protein [Burkholderiales bacterium]
MRYLKYGLVAMTPMLGAAGFAQGLSVGMSDGVFLQAQAPSQPSQYSPGQNPTDGKPAADRDSGSNRAGTGGTGANEEGKLGTNVPKATDPAMGDGRAAERTSEPKTQARKKDKKSKDTGVN